ncbi:MAG: alpha/beta fold hydrolase [Betaproteobacteria bacterium]|nr:alpha/beta fold hydrolase [Betaproteobacteria bacterium]
MPKAAVAGGEIYYEDAGQGEPVVFSSGLNGVSRYWKPQVALFSKHFRVITYDHRGTGQSDRIQREFSVDQMAEELVGLMDALNIPKAHIVGMSTGGAIGQTIAIEHPQRVMKLALCSTWTHCDPWFRRLFQARRDMYLQAGPELHAQFHPLFLYSPDYVNAHDAEIEHERKNAPTKSSPVEVSVGRIDALMKFDRRAGLPNIKAQTLVLGSDSDFITPSYFSEALAQAIPGAKLIMVKGGGHSFTTTRAEQFNRDLMAFLRT